MKEMKEEVKHLYIEHLGCAKNQVDAEVMAEALKGDGYVSVEEASDADVILVNTCGFIESAREESINTFFALKQEYPAAKILLTGCMAQRYAESLYEELPEADAIFGNRDLKDISEVVRSVTQGERVLDVPSYPPVNKEYDSRGQLFNFPGSAYLKLSEGCNHCCRYCAIPLIRGGLRSRTKEAILSDAKQLIASGVKEINLIAQDLAAYGTDTEKSSQFLPLLEELAVLEGIGVIRLLYIHPDAFPMELLDLMKKFPVIIPYFDIPFQHAHPDVLRKMGRVGDSETYLNLVKRIRDEFPEAVIRTTFMLGFTGESDETYEELLNFIRALKPDYAGSFVYSPEEGTPAFADAAEKELKKRLKRAVKRQSEVDTLCREFTGKSLEKFVGRKMPVLVEELIEGEELALGRTYYQAPEVDGLTVIKGENLPVGEYVQCYIEKVNGVDLEAVVIR